MEGTLKAILSIEMIPGGINDPNVTDKNVYKDVLVLLDILHYQDQSVRSKIKAFLYIYKEIESLYVHVVADLTYSVFFRNETKRKILKKRIETIRKEVTDLILSKKEDDLNFHDIKERLNYWIFSLEH